jgi:hypothetical protein
MYYPLDSAKFSEYVLTANRNLGFPSSLKSEHRIPSLIMPFDLEDLRRGLPPATPSGNLPAHQTGTSTSEKSCRPETKLINKSSQYQYLMQDGTFLENAEWDLTRAGP